MFNTSIKNIVQHKLDSLGYDSFFDFCKDSYLKSSKLREDVPGYFLVSSALGKLQFLDVKLTYIDVSNENLLDELLVEMYYLINLCISCVPVKCRIITDDLGGIIPNFHTAFVCAWDLSNADKNEIENKLWRDIMTQLKLLLRKVDLMSYKNCGLDYQNYLLDQLSVWEEVKSKFKEILKWKKS